MKVCREFIEKYFFPDQVTLYLGIDFWEKERLEKSQSHWLPYKLESPLCSDNFQWIDKNSIFDFLREINLTPPRLYSLGFSHANCGGFCVRAGKKQFFKLFQAFPELYLWHEEQELNFQLVNNSSYTILREMKQGDKTRISLRELRERDFISPIMDNSNTCSCFLD